MFYVRRHYLSSRYDDSKSPMGPIGIKGMTSSSPSSGLPTSGTGGRAVGGLEGGESDLHLTQNITLRKKRKIFGGKQQKTATGTNNFSLSLDRNYDEEMNNCRCSVVFVVEDEVGGLMKVIQVFKHYNINIRHIESRQPIKGAERGHNVEKGVDEKNGKVDVPNGELEEEERLTFFCDLDGNAESLLLAIKILKNSILEFAFNDNSLFTTTITAEDKKSDRGTNVNNCVEEEYSKNSEEGTNRDTNGAKSDMGEGIGDRDPKPWYPTRIRDLDKICNRVFMAGVDLDCDHPGFKDPVYTKRRQMFAEISYNYRHGQPIPIIEYSEEENRTWATVYKELTKLYPKYACREYLVNLPLLELYCGYADGKVPQLNDVNNFLMEKTGFSLRPVAGYLSSRDFLSALAFRVFCCTQYIRHSSDPFYTPEPDCCHELLGHVPMLADKTFADFSQEIGLASLGASDEYIDKLSKLYFFTVEFGLCRQEGEVRIYGAGLLSSIGELKHSMEKIDKQKDFSVDGILDMTCNITTFQDGYFVNSSFETAKAQLREFADSIEKNCHIKYNPYTRSIDVLRSNNDFLFALDAIRHELNALTDRMMRANNTSNTEKRLTSERDWEDFIDNLCPSSSETDTDTCSNNKNNAS